MSAFRDEVMRELGCEAVRDWRHYKIRNDDDAEWCLCALLDYMEDHDSAAERMALVLKMNILRLVAKVRRINNDIIREG